MTDSAVLKRKIAVDKMVAKVTKLAQTAERDKKRRLLKRRVKRVTARMVAGKPGLRLAKPKPIPPTFDRATELRQAKLVDILFKGSYLAVAWRMAGYSPTHHASLIKILSSPHIRAEIVRHLNRGEKLRGRLHERVVAKLGWRPVRLEDLI